jgi:carboxypeptidase C (cathepsin A)
MFRAPLAALAALALTTAALAARADDPAPAPAAGDKALAEKIDAATARPPIDEAQSTTHHSVTIRGRALAYDATAGTLTIRDNDGKPTASVFYVAYVANPGGARRPVTFLYNGGPGSSSLWLHMGSLGPLRLRTASPAATGPAPYAFAPNDETLLDKTDLVFIDAIGTGFSRPLGKTELKTFWGVDQDADAFARAISRYVILNGRANSPKFLFGESYGTTRSAALAYQLHQRGMDLNGVILLSSWLNTNTDNPGIDLTYVENLPTYAATAWYHDRIPNKPADEAAFLRDARAFAAGPYATALFKGQDISPEEEDAVAQKLSGFTGLSVDYLKRAKLRVNLDRFRKELLRDQGHTVGRLDTRFLGSDEDTAGENPDYDAASSGISGAFTAALTEYVTGELKFKTNMDYRPSYYGAGAEWDYGHKGPNSGGFKARDSAVMLDLAQTMRENPHMKVLSLNGWYDLATPFFATEYDAGRMLLDPDQRKNLSFAYYPAGHMVYLNPEALKQMRADLARFYEEAAP